MNHWALKKIVTYITHYTCIIDPAEDITVHIVTMKYLKKNSSNYEAFGSELLEKNYFKNVTSLLIAVGWS